MSRPVRPINWARQENVDELREAVLELNDALGGIAVSLIHVQNDLREMREDLYEPDQDTGFVDDLGPVPEVPTDEELEDDRATGEGMPEAETEAQRQARVEASRARRAAGIKSQGLKAFEDGNEEAPRARDVNDVDDIPDEGITVQPGYDPVEDYDTGSA